MTKCVIPESECKALLFDIFIRTILWFKEQDHGVFNFKSLEFSTIMY